MAGESTQLAHEHDETWRELETTLAQIAKTAKSDASFHDFAGELLEQTIHLLAAVGGAVWIREDAGPLRLVCQVALDVLGCPAEEGAHRQLLERVFRRGDVEEFHPSMSVDGSDDLPNPSEFILVMSPVRVDQRVVAVVELAQRPGAGKAALRGNCRFLSLVSELAADHLRNAQMRQLQWAQSQTERFGELLGRLHGSLDLRATAYEIANEGCQYIGCDRLSVALRHGRSYRLLAISGAESINRRSQALRCLERLVARVTLTRQSMWLLDGGIDLPPQIEQPLRQYADLTHPRSLGIVPLLTPAIQTRDRDAPQLGALIIEQFDGSLDQQLQGRGLQVAQHAAAALRNCLQYRALPTLPFARWRHGPYGTPRIRWRTLLLLLIAVCASTTLLFLSARFDIRAQGELQPTHQTQVFAPLDSQVMRVAAEHGELVQEGDLLLELHSPEIDLAMERIRGEYETTKKRLVAIESTLLQASTINESNDIEVSRLSGEEAELRHLIESQSRQLKLLRQQRQQLIVRSPQDGRVVTWSLDQLLQNRPLQRGQALLSVARLTGPWQAELRVPERQIGHVLELVDQQLETPLTSFELATNRGVVHEGTVHSIARRTELDPHDRSIVRVTLDVRSAEVDDLRPGATIFARIHCGRRPLGYVLFHDILDAIRGWFIF